MYPTVQITVPSDATVEYYALRGQVDRIRARIASGELSPISGVGADPVTRLTRECSALRLRVATAERRSRRGAATAPNTARTPPTRPLALLPANLDTTHIQRDIACAQLEADAMKLNERCKMLEKSLKDMQDILKTKDKEIEALKKERERLVIERDQALERVKSRSPSRPREREQKPDRSVQRLSSNNSDGDGQLLKSHRNPEPSRSRNPTRKSENSSAIPHVPAFCHDAERIARARSRDVFLTKTDSWSGAQVIQAVEDLNAEISHFAAAATETCAFARRGKTKVRAKGQDEITPWLGAPLARILATRDHAQDPIMVQLALQASIATCCARSLSLFCVGFPAKLDALLTRVLEHMHASEPQATSARWRALTHRTIRTLYPGLEEYATTELVNTMLRWSAAVFAVSGSSSSAESSPIPFVAQPAGSMRPAGGSPTPPLAALRAQLRRIAEAVYRLAQAMREEVLSTSFEVVLIESGAMFQAGKMVNKLGASGDWDSVGGEDVGKLLKEEGIVLCTTELGLQCVTKKAQLGEDEDTEVEQRTLLLPKVVLDSAVEMLDHE